MKGFIKAAKLLSKERQFSGPPLLDPENRFHNAYERIELSNLFHPSYDHIAPIGYYMMRPIYCGTNSIIGSVFVGTTPQEAIVIDEKYELLKALFATLKIKFFKTQGVFEGELVSDVFKASHNLLEWNPQKITSLLQIYRINPDEKVTLDLFVRERVGVARHRALLAIYLIEKFNRQGYLKYKATMAPCYTDPFGHDEKVEYTLSSGEIVSYDPSVQQIELCVQNRLGSLYESKTDQTASP